MEDSEQFVERRAFERISSNINVKFYSDNAVYFGTVTDFSANGMFVSTKYNPFPLYAQFEIFIPSINNEELLVPVKITRLANSNGICYGMGVELLKIPEDSLALMNDI
jgi:hypothetical protein